MAPADKKFPRLRQQTIHVNGTDSKASHQQAMVAKLLDCRVPVSALTTGGVPFGKLTFFSSSVNGDADNNTSTHIIGLLRRLNEPSRVQCLVCLLCRTQLIKCDPAASEALRTMTISDQGCAFDFARDTAAWSAGRWGEEPGEATAVWSRPGQCARVPLPSTGQSPQRCVRTPRTISVFSCSNTLCFKKSPLQRVSQPI